MPRKFNILMIAPTPFFADRGCHKRIYEEARELQRRGNRVVVCTYHIGRDIEGIETERIINIPWYKKLEAGPSWHKFYLDLLLFFKCFGVSLREKPDIFHGHLHEGALIARVLGWLFRKPMVFDAQGSLTGEMQDHGFLGSKGIRYRFFRWLESLIYRISDRMIISSNQAYDLLMKNFSINRDKARPIIDGVDIERFQPQRSTEGLREKWHLPPHKHIVIYVGLLTKYQGAEYLLKSLKQLLKLRKDVHFLIIGFPLQPYKSLAEKEGLQEYMTFVGKIPYDELPKYLSMAEVAISPKISLTEGNGKLYDYMAMGIPSVVFESGVNREILGDLGFYAAMSNARAFAEQVDRALKLQKEEKEKLKEKLRKRAEQLFSYHMRGKEIVEVYNSLLQ
jgi:glycosyltransferase involved in cell wall biosynthesis